MTALMKTNAEIMVAFWAYLYLEDGTFVQKELLMKGYAAAYTKYPFGKKEKDRFLAWEKQAKQGGLGLWKDGGMTEALWILERKQLLIRDRENCFKPTTTGFELETGSSRPFPHETKSAIIWYTALFRWAHALGARRSQENN